MAEGQGGFDGGRQHLGHVYAQALLGAAEKAGQAEAVVEQLESLVNDVFARLPNLEAALTSPRVEQADKLRLLDRTFAGKTSPLLLNFLKVTAEHGRLDCLRAMALAARDELHKLRGIVEVELRTAAPLSNPVRESIAARLQELLKSKVQLHVKVDAALLGGLVVRIGDTVYDGSLANRLERLREDAVESAKKKFRESLEQFALSR